MKRAEQGEAKLLLRAGMRWVLGRARGPLVQVAGVREGRHTSQRVLRARLQGLTLLQRAWKPLEPASGKDRAMEPREGVSSVSGLMSVHSGASGPILTELFCCLQLENCPTNVVLRVPVREELVTVRV